MTWELRRHVQMALPPCVRHVMYAVNRYVRGSPIMLKAAIRVLGEAVLETATEIAFFKAGAIDAALDMSSRLSEIGAFNCGESARLFFNLTLYVTKPRGVDVGIFAHLRLG